MLVRTEPVVWRACRCPEALSDDEWTRLEGRMTVASTVRAALRETHRTANNFVVRQLELGGLVNGRCACP